MSAKKDSERLVKEAKPARGNGTLRKELLDVQDEHQAHYDSLLLISEKLVGLEKKIEFKQSQRPGPDEARMAERKSLVFAVAMGEKSDDDLIRFDAAGAKDREKERAALDVWQAEIDRLQDQVKEAREKYATHEAGLEAAAKKHWALLDDAYQQEAERLGAEYHEAGRITTDRLNRVMAFESLLKTHRQEMLKANRQNTAFIGESFQHLLIPSLGLKTAEPDFVPIGEAGILFGFKRQDADRALEEEKARLKKEGVEIELRPWK